MIERRQRPWHLFGLVLVAVGVAVLAIAQIGPPASSARTSKQVVTAQRGVVQSTVSGSGNVEAGSDLDVNFQTSGTLSHVYVKVGEHVNQGELLATLDPTSAQLTVDQVQKNLASAEDQLTAAENGSSTSSGSTTTSADVTGGSSTTDFVSYTAITPHAQTATTSSASTTTTTTTASPTTTTPTTSTPTTTTTPSTPSTTTPATTPPATTTPTTTTPATPATSGTAGNSGASGSTSTTSSASSIASAEASLYSAKASLHSARQALAQTRLYAPISGTIVSLSSLQPGDSVSAGSSSSASSSSSNGSSSSSSTGSTTAGSLGSSGSSSSSTGSSSGSFVEIVNTHKLTMTVAFSESDISKVKLGQAATVTLDALTGVQLGAHVTAISTVGTTSSSVVSYDATLTLEQSDRRVKPGMSASASVITDQAQGVTLPNDAVTGSGSLATVRMLRDGKTISQQVVVGLKGDSRTQIVSGLRAADQVVVTTSLPSLGSSSSSAGNSTGTLGGTGSRLGGAGLGGGGFPGGGFPGGGFPGGG